MRAVLVSLEAFRERRRRLVERSADYAQACVEAIARGDGPYLTIGLSGFRWECPGCGHVYVGQLGDEPVSGWDSPRWRLSGPEGRPTLEPSLGCSRWRDGSCPSGHWWLRAGELVKA